MHKIDNNINDMSLIDKLKRQVAIDLQVKNGFLYQIKKLKEKVDDRDKRIVELELELKKLKK